MSTYTATLTVAVVPAIGVTAATETDEEALVAEIENKINELDHAAKGSAMITVVATITKD
ncbi:MAG: hypothetical protein MUQ00_13355 [Candidatus Aminicenantes bacterium]|nr:hypothetical protein [Candidatus Aminicenantes bacterium]